jgi:cellulose synthase/poly-beta-1,6-N-acetylglucosamine synthase-like glycosyltransferase
MASAALLLAFGINHIVLLVLFVIRRKGGLARECAALARTLPPDDQLPHIVVQIPVYNENLLVERAISCAAALDWPRDKLHIQICDNSTDETPDIARQVARRLAEDGTDASVVHRDGRVEAKAGNLRFGMQATDPSYGYFAVLDVDYMPPRNFLRLCMAPLVDNPTLDFVQARPDYLNATENRVTRAQALSLDSHYATEEATRCWAGHILLLKGSCMIIRREAIEEAGGWSGKTLTEDVAMSCRLWICGKRGLFVTSFPVPGELPATRQAWVAQQLRWTTGFGEVARSLIPVMLTLPKTSLWVRYTSAAPLIYWMAAPLYTTTFISTVIAFVLRPELLSTLGIFFLGLFGVGHVLLFTQMRMGQRFLRGSGIPLRTFCAEYLYLQYLGVFLGAGNVRAYWKVMLRRSVPFEKTPKSGSITG